MEKSIIVKSNYLIIDRTNVRVGTACRQRGTGGRCSFVSRRSTAYIQTPATLAAMAQDLAELNVCSDNTPVHHRVHALAVPAEDVEVHMVHIW